jgi:hypothetical protein
VIKHLSKRGELAELPYLATYLDCLDAIEQEQVRGVYVSWLMAIVIHASNGQGYFDVGEDSYKHRLKELPINTLLQRKQWVEYITVEEHLHRGKIPKFRYCSRLSAELARSRHLNELTHLERLVMSCKWGLVGAPGLFCFDALGDKNVESEFRKYASNTHLQLRRLVQQLKSLSYESRGDVAQMFDLHCTYPGSAVITETGRILAIMSANFGESIAARGLKQSL